MRRTIRLAGAAALTTLAVTASPSRADDTEQARTLFESGVADLDAGAYEKACPAIEHSFRLDPRPGTLFTLAECEAKRGRLATAVARYTEYLGVYKNFTTKKRLEQKERADTSTAQLAALAPHVPALTLRLPQGAPEDVVVKRDGQIVPAPSIGTALGMDPGEHVITTQVPGGPLVEHRVALAKGEKKELRLTLKTEPEPPPEPPLPPPPPRPAATPSLPPAATPSLPPAATPPDTGAFRAGILTAGAVGAAGVLVGVVTGVLAVDRKAVVDRDCTRTGAAFACTTAEGVAAGQSLKDFGAASTAAFVVGLAGLGAAGAVLLAMPSPPQPPPQPAQKARRPALVVAIAPGGVRIGGAF